MRADRHVAFTLLSVAIVILLLQLMRPVLIPFVVGGLLFYALDPAVDWLQKKRVPRFIGAALMLALVVTGGAALTYSLQGQALTVVDKLPAGARKLTAMLRKTPGAESGTLEKVQEAAEVLQTGGESARRVPGVLKVQVQDEGFEASTFVWSSSLARCRASTSS